MKTKPILFNTEMVQAILDGRKTQTRRTIKPQPEEVKDQDGIPHLWIPGIGALDEFIFTNEKMKVQKGDILWVRETWSLAGWDWQSGDISIQYKDGKIITQDPDELTDGTHVSDWLLRKTDKLEEQGYLKQDPEDEERLMHVKTKWEPSIFMPKWACRIWLEVTDVRVERLQDISEADAIAEGIDVSINSNGSSYCDYTLKNKEDQFEWYTSPKLSFFSLWKYINGKASLDANPWVWVYTFKRCEMPKDFLR
jgi:hypothetical protein